MDWDFWAVAAAAAVHVGEEDVWPGGLHAWLNRRRRTPTALAAAAFAGAAP